MRVAYGRRMTTLHELAFVLSLASLAGCASVAPVDRICVLEVDDCHVDATHDACVARTNAAVAGTVDPAGCLELRAQCAQCMSNLIHHAGQTASDVCSTPVTPCARDCATPTPSPCAPTCRVASDCGAFGRCVDGACTS